MKNIKSRIILFILITFTLSSCYKDKGNYIYETINKITISGLNSTYNATLNETTLDFTIDVKSDDAAVELEYLWRIYQKDLVGAPMKWDTLSTTKNFNYFATQPQGKYNLELRITEKKSQVMHYFYSLITIGTKYTEGWYVLKGDGVKSDLDLYLDGKTTRDLLPTNGKMQGSPVALSYTTSYCYMDEIGAIQRKQKVFFVQTEYDVKVFDIATMKMLKDFDNLFFLKPTTPQKQYSFASNASTTYSLIDESGVRKNGNNVSLGILDVPMTINDGEPYRMSPYSMRKGSNTIYYDELNCRMVYQPYNGQNLVVSDEKDLTGKIGKYSPTNMNANCLFMGTFGNGEVAGFGVFENRTTKERSFYEFNPATYATYKNPIVNIVKIPANFKLHKATVYALNLDNKILYYNNENKLGIYKIEINEEKPDIHTFEAGSEITYIGYKYNRTYMGDPLYYFDKLVIATTKGGSYKVYIYNMLAGEPNGTPEIIEGDGRAVDVMWISPLTSFNLNYR